MVTSYKRTIAGQRSTFRTRRFFLIGLMLIPLHVSKCEDTLRNFNGVEFLKSQKGKRILRYKGYTYYSQYVGSKTRWLCSTHYPKGCRASVYTINDKVIQLTGQHNHAFKPRIHMSKVVAIQGVYNPHNSVKYEAINLQRSRELTIQRNNQNVQQYLNIKNEIKTDQLSIGHSEQNILNMYKNIGSPSSALNHSFIIPQLTNTGRVSQHHEKDDQQRLTGDQAIPRLDHLGFYNYYSK